MKRWTAFLAAAALVLGLTACQNESVGQTGHPEISEEADTKSEIGKAEGSNILIAYFSVPEAVETAGTDAVAGSSVVVKNGEKMGNTEYVARLIQQTIGGDLFRIETAESYPLNHEELVNQAADEQDEEARPELSAHVENFERYEYVLLTGSPCQKCTAARRLRNRSQGIRDETESNFKTCD